MRLRRLSRHRQSGFTLIWMSILLTVAALIFVSFLPGKEAGDYGQKTVTNIQKLDKVEAAMRAFMAFKGRRPCPAQGSYDINAANFGVEAATPGTCTGGTPAAPLGPDAGTGYVVGGMIPTKTLGLPDDYAFDEFGRQFTYVVDKRATKLSTCLTLQNYPTNNGTGGVAVESSTGGTVLDNTMVAYISHGPDGHGAFPAQGSTAAGRINTGSTDTDQLTNAGVDSSFTYNTNNFTNVKVKKDKTSTFDDLVYYRSDIKNTCCLGSAACVVPPGFRINGITTNGNLGIQIAHGHIHDATINDLVISDGSGNVYVIFGGTFSRSNYTVDNNATTGLIDGTHGFKIYDSTDSQLGSPIAVGDVNGDGYDDIVACNGNNNNGLTGDNGAADTCHVFYGHGGAFSASYDIKTDTTCQWTSFVDGGGVASRINGLAIADVNNDTYKDIIVGDWNASLSIGWGKGQVYVIFGRANTCPGTEPITSGLNISTLTSGTTPKGAIISGSTANWGFGNNVAAGDVNGDGINDIIISASSYSGSGRYGRIYVIAGQSAAHWPSTIAASALAGIPANGACASPYNTCGSAINGSTCGSTFGGQLAVGDVTGDGYADILIASDNKSSCDDAYVVKGAAPATAWNTSYDLAGPAGAALDIHDSAEGGGFAAAAIGDVNQDGTSDAMFGYLNPQTGGGGVGNANGSVYMLFGGASLAGGDWFNTPPTGANGVRIDCSYSNPDGDTDFNGLAETSCGAYLDAVDMDGDGTTDLVISVRYGSVTGSNQEGYVYVLYGKSSGWTTPYALSTIY